MFITIWHHLPEYTVISRSKFSHCLTGSLTFNIFGSRLTCSGLKLMWNLTTNALGGKITWSTTHVSLNQMNPVNWDGWMSCGSIITAGGMWSGTGLCISGVPVVTQPSWSSFPVRLPIGWLGRCIWSTLGLQHVSLCAVDLTHVKMGADGENQRTISVK